MTHIALRSLAKGLGSFVVPQLRNTHVEGGTASARHCYDLFFRHYGHLAPWLNGKRPEVLVEVGPGSSLGVGLAALLAGVDTYIGLDLQDHRSMEHDLEVLSGLIELFGERAAFWDNTVSGDIFFPPSPTNFAWNRIDGIVQQRLSAEAIDALKADLVNGSERLKFVAPWTDFNVLQAGVADWLMTHSVMEHVDNLVDTYIAIARWLKPGGFATHLIDFQSHGLSSDWNGHWVLSAPTWTMMRGRRPYLINRKWRSHHINLMQESGFEILAELQYIRTDGLGRKELRAPFTSMPDGDEKVAMSFFVTRKIG
ncbi:hypothetical protein CO652_20790 [Rhizobium sp. H4]|uniref:hypothetical protein n=1 Tax=Rhizobium sp. H4 TaxID=2035449 RepID=UPI000BEA7552|nr:hypothetical protein [Rhizobium sp. H4]PDV86509.1 hypothetical protein CO652_20790 [Rhizobium sp. H4]